MGCFQMPQDQLVVEHGVQWPVAVAELPMGTYTSPVYIFYPKFSQIHIEFAHTVHNRYIPIQMHTPFSLW